MISVNHQQAAVIKHFLTVQQLFSVKQTFFDNGQSHCVHLLSWNEGKPENEIAKDDESLFWWLALIIVQWRRMVHQRWENSSFESGLQAEILIHAGFCSRCWIKCWVLHLIHLWLLGVSINDSSDSNRLEAFVPRAPVRMEILAWTSVVYQRRHLTFYFTDISHFLALSFQDMVQLCRLHTQQYPCWMDSFF